MKKYTAFDILLEVFVCVTICIYCRRNGGCIWQRKRREAGHYVFLSYFLRAIVLILGVVIIGLTVVLIKQVHSAKAAEKDNVSDEAMLSDTQTDDLLTAQGSEDTTEVASTEAEDVLFENTVAAEPDHSVPVLVMNGTEVAGLAAAWKTKIEALGYTNVSTGNYTDGGVTTSKVVIGEGLNADDIMSAVSGATSEVGDGTNINTDVEKDGIKIFVIIGTYNDIVSGQ